MREASTPRRVAIIGGGLAGMAAAWGLSQPNLFPAGIHIDLFEAKRLSGGRAGSFTDPTSGREVDYCQHVAMGCCTNFIHLMRQANLLAEFHRQQQLCFHSDGPQVSVFKRSPWLPNPLDLAPSFAAMSFLSWRDRRAVARGFLRLIRTPAPSSQPPSSHDAEPTMGQWLKEHGQPQSAIDNFWNLFLVSALGEEVDAVAFGPARKVFVDGFLRHPQSSDVLIPQQPLSELFGVRLPRQLSQRGVHLHFNNPVRRIEKTSAGHFTLQCATDSLTSKRDYDAVITAVPWHSFPRLFRDSPLADSLQPTIAAADLPSSPISGIHLWLDRPITTAANAVIVGQTSQWVFNPSYLNTAENESTNAAAGHYTQVVISAARNLRGSQKPATIEETVMHELNTLFPAPQQAVCLRYRVITDPHAVYSITPTTERQRPATTTPELGFFVAGDWVQTGWPATMEGAVISGYLAAEEVLGYFGKRTKITQSPLPTTWLPRLLIR